MATAAKKKARKARGKAQRSGQDDREEEDEEEWADPQTAKVNKIFPRNLTARAGYLVAGNPVVTRPEDAVANCFPGLEVDIRNLDRRFFPGLVFEFVDDGAKLAYVDALEDPDLQLPRDEAKDLNKLLTNDEIREPLETGKLLPGTSRKKRSNRGKWYLDWIKQGPKRISMPHDGIKTWRLVRSLEPDPPLTIGLKLRPAKGAGKEQGDDTLKLDGWRRRYTDKTTGVINGAYQPGELGQGLCSPWQHDFRDCQCFYWAANHPDVVLGELYPGEALPPENEALDGQQAGQSGAQPTTQDGTSSSPSAKDGKSANKDKSASSQGEPLYSIPLDWIRADRSRSLSAEALGTIAENRPYQLDHFQINRAWQDLSIVLEGREIGGVYTPQTIETANPFRSLAVLGEHLRTLARLELALVFEYLYAYFSVLDEEDPAAKRGGKELRGAVMMARRNLMLIATSEMQHLRWANQLLWELKLTDKFEPVLEPIDKIPTNPASLERHQRLRAAGRAERALLGARKGMKKSLLRQRAMDAGQKALDTFTRTERSGRSGSSDTRKAEERSFTPDVIDDFIAVEHPSGAIDGAYAKCIATLQKFGRQDMAELALRIAADGVRHEIQFRQIKSALWPFFGKNPDERDPVYLRKVSKADPEEPGEAAAARTLLLDIKDDLRKAYKFAGNNAIELSGENIAKARIAMTKLIRVGDDLAKRKKGIGIPFFEFWKSPR